MPRIHDHENEICYFAKTNHRNQGVKFGIKTDDRRRHVYLVGKTGVGKTTVLENMVLQDIYNGHGLCYIDPHGDTVEKMLDFIPSWRLNDVIYFNPADLDYPIGFNVLESVEDRHKHLVASGLMGVFQKIWANMWSARMEYLLNNAVLALLDNPGSTLLGINRLFSDEEYRKKIITNIKDPIVKQFWLMEYASYSEKYATEAVAAIQNKVGQFLSASIIRNIVAQVKSSIDIRDIMDSQKIFLVNLSKGRIGEDNSRLLGGMIVTKIQLSAMERVDMPEKTRKDFYLYVDEFQNFATESFANILSEARKYRLNLIVAHQYMGQLIDKGNTAVLDAVLGNVGSIIAFRVGAPDAEVLEKEFMPRFLIEDLINLPKHQIYLKLMIDGVTSEAFSALTLPPIAARTGSEEKAIRVSRERYGGSREDIENKISKWSGMGSDINIEEIIEEAKAKARGGQAKKKNKYKCSHCARDMSLPVELDRARPIFCETCRPIVSDLKKTGKYDAKLDLIYNEDLGVAGSVAELGSDGSWKNREAGKQGIRESEKQGNGEAGKMDIAGNEVKKPETSEPDEKISLKVIADSVKKENPPGNAEHKRKRRRRGGSGIGSAASARPTVSNPTPVSRPSNEKTGTPLKAGEVKSFGDTP